MKKPNFKYDDLRKILIIFGLLNVIMYFVIYVIRHFDMIWTAIHFESSLNNITTLLHDKSPINFVILVLLTSVTAAIPFLSNAIFQLFNGIIYGPFIGFLMNLCGNILGNFLFIKLLNRIDITDRDLIFKDHLHILKDSKNKNIAFILGYMIPIMPTILVNYGIVDMKVPWRKWLVYVSIGVMPTSLIYALGGGAIMDGNFKLTILLLVLIILVYLGVSFFKRKR